MEIAFAMLAVLLLLLIGFAAMARRMLRYFSEHASWRFPRALVSATDYLPGDIVLFTGHTHGFVNSVFTLDFYTHAAMVVADPDTGDLFLSETMIGDEIMPDADEPDGERVAGGKTVLLPLYARLKYYQGEHFLMRLAPALTPRQAAALWEHARTVVPYPSFWNSLLRVARLDLLLQDGGCAERHCMAHVGWLLDQLGLTPTELIEKGKKLHRGPFLGICRRITRLHQETLGRGQDGRATHRYLPPVHMLYDLDAGAVPKYVPAAKGMAPAAG